MRRRSSVLAILALTTWAVAGCGMQAGPSFVPVTTPTAAPTTRLAPASVAPPTATSDAPAEASPSVAAVVDAPLILDVNCTADGAVPAGHAVAAQSDGVHFRLHGDLDAVSFFAGDAGGNEGPDHGWRLPPGPSRIGCLPRDADAGTVEWVPITVVDPEGFYVPTAMDCPGGSMSTGVVDYAAGAPGQGDDPVAIARGSFEDLRPGDVVEAAGYPAATRPEVRIVRDGAVVAVLMFEPAQGGGWLRSSTTKC